jgi:hypothetical protein
MFGEFEFESRGLRHPQPVHAFFAAGFLVAYEHRFVRACPHCDAPLTTPAPAICASCGNTLGDPPRRDSQRPAAVAEQTLFEGHPAIVGTIGELLLVICTLGLAWFWLAARSRSTAYKVTTSRVVVETGLANKKIEQVDLFRVVDFAVLLPIGERLVGTGTLVLEADDRTLQQAPAKGSLRLARIRTDVRALYERLRVARDADRSRRGVMALDRV